MDLSVLEKVFEHAKAVDEWCAKNGGLRIMTALYGSQNYGLDTANSDVDTKSIIVPDLADWTWGDINKYNTVITMSDNSHAEMKNITDMCKQYMKSNINFLETLYTEYVDIAPGWEWFYEDLIGVRDNISRYNMYRAGKTWLGYMAQALERAFTNTSVTLGYRKDCEYNPKALMNAFRIKESIIRFFEFHRPFEEAIDMSSMRRMLLDIKENPMPYDVALIYCEKLQNWIEKEHRYIETHYSDKQVFNCKFYLQQTCKLIYGYLVQNEMN